MLMPAFEAAGAVGINVEDCVPGTLALEPITVQADKIASIAKETTKAGVPIVIKHRPRRPRRPEIYVLCDVSTSVSSASVFFLSVLHALHDSFRRMRSFVFIERVSEVTDVFARERSEPSLATLGSPTTK